MNFHSSRNTIGDARKTPAMSESFSSTMKYSAGPVKTLAAAGIGGFSSILGVVREKAPLRRAIETSEVGDAAAFLLSDAGRGVTGEVLMVDAGFHVLGM